MYLWSVLGGRRLINAAIVHDFDVRDSRLRPIVHRLIGGRLVTSWRTERLF